MNRISADIRKNRIYICLEQAERKEINQIIELIEKECRKLRRGFSCVTDISNYVPISETDEDLLIQAQIMLWQAGMTNVVRVRSAGAHSIQGELQFEKASRLSAGYSAVSADSIEEAEKLLDGGMEISDL